MENTDWFITSMTDELDDLERRGLVNRSEISEIIRRRCEFEHRLNRPNSLKQDYLDCLDYEMELDRLRQRNYIEDDTAVDYDLKVLGFPNLRKRDLIGYDFVTQKGSISDIKGVWRILHVYRRATKRHAKDLDICFWFRYLDFCRERHPSLVRLVLSQAISIHPNVPGFWIYAAAWQIDEYLDVAKARSFMQKGIRLCPKSEDLWIAYFRMEVTYLNKLKARKIALGEDVKPVEHDSEKSKQWREENKDLLMPLNGGEKEDEESWQHRSMILLQTVYHEAVKAIPSSLSLRERFLEILNTVGMTHSDKLKAEVYEEASSMISSIKIDAVASSSNSASTRPELATRVGCGCASGLAKVIA